MGADTIVNLAKAAWKVIEDGKPSIETTQSKGSAVPQVSDWQQMEHTLGPMSARTTWEMAVNGFPSYVWSDCKLNLKWDYGATYRGGGAFIPNVWVEVEEAYAGWSWHLDVDVRILDVTNFGTKEAPIARVPVEFTFSLNTFERSDVSSIGVVIFGDGTFQRA
jgi:hypothetical protein